jgi:hypothetical protein
MGISDDGDRLMNEIRARARMEGELPSDVARTNGGAVDPDVSASGSAPNVEPGAAAEHETAGQQDPDLLDLRPLRHLEERAGPAGAGSTIEAHHVDHVESDATADDAGWTVATDSKSLPAVSHATPLAESTGAAEERVKRLEAVSNIAESIGLGYHLGSAIERIFVGAGEGSQGVSSLQEATWLIERYISIVQQRPVGADLQATSTRLSRSTELIAELNALSAALDAQTAAEQARRTVVTADRQVLEPSADAQKQEELGSGRAGNVSIEGAAPQEPLGREIVLMLARWSMIVLAMIVVVLAITLIGQWR